MTLSEGTASQVIDVARAWIGLINGASSAAKRSFSLPVLLIKWKLTDAGFLGEGIRSFECGHQYMSPLTIPLETITLAL